LYIRPIREGVVSILLKKKKSLLATMVGFWIIFCIALPAVAGQDEGENDCNNAAGAYMAQDYRNAMKWYKKAAALGDSDGELGIGGLYLRGLGVERNYSKAREWFKKAASHGNKLAIQRLPYLEKIWGTSDDDGGRLDRGKGVQGQTVEDRLLYAATKLESFETRSAELKSNYEDYAYNYPDDQEGIQMRRKKYANYATKHQYEIQQCGVDLQFCEQSMGMEKYIGTLRRNGFGNLLQ
jgi:Sel1 repeat